MNNQIFTPNQFDQMTDEVMRVLSSVGFLVDHPEVKAMALQAGCQESPDGRILFHDGPVNILRKELRNQHPTAHQNGATPSWIHPRQELAFSFGNITPKYYDFATGRPEGGTTARFLDTVKFAHAEPRITGITIPLSRQDTHPAIEQLESIVLMAKTTDMPLGVIDATVPESVPFLAEMGAVLGQDPSAFVGSCNCINPPMRLEERTAATMLQRSRFHSRSMITSMPCIGGSGPVDIHGGVVLATAEIVGGLILSMIIDPSAPLLGYIACIQLDMRTGNPTSSTPQTVLLDAGVYQLMNYAFGGGTAVGGRSYITARRPGLQAVFERVLKGLGYSALVDQHQFVLAGTGNLDNGSTISPEQFLLDIEMTEGLDRLFTAPVMSPPGDTVDRIRECIVAGGGNFMATEHTLEHFRDEMWDPQLFRRATETASEQNILNQCHASYVDTLASYTPASYPEDIVRELEQILTRARNAFVA